MSRSRGRPSGPPRLPPLKDRGIAVRSGGAAGNLYIRAAWWEFDAPILWLIGGPEDVDRPGNWQASPFTSRQVGYSWTEASRLIADWIKATKDGGH